MRYSSTRQFAIGAVAYEMASVASATNAGADYRNALISLAGVAGAATLSLLVELVSFNANLGLAQKVTPELSVGVALTVGWGWHSSVRTESPAASRRATSVAPRAACTPLAAARRSAPSTRSAPMFC